MKKALTALFYAFFLSTGSYIFCQNQESSAWEYLHSRGEVYFRFKQPDRETFLKLSRVISVDRIRGNEVFAYANQKGFRVFTETGIPFTVLTPPSMLLSPAELHPGVVQNDERGRTIWNFYPSYAEYLSFMEGFAASYPSICRLDTLGLSLQGRLILAVKISDNVGQDDPEPQFLYTSSIHGDELAGYVLMLHLIDYLLSEYGTNPRITEMVDRNEIYINPLANPDGTFYGGNNSVYGAIRFNANNIDLNRNYPDPEDGPHPDGNPWQVETEVFMAYAESMNFTVSCNFHGGAEVFNYPWDTWPRLHADDSWWRFVGREWADTVHKYSFPGYFTDLQNGITNGYAWYTISGGRQDYMNFWHACREVTLEISEIKLLPANQLLNWWNYNYRSFLNYIDQAGYGFNGIITDSVTGEPLIAKVFIFGHDKDGSFVYSRLPHGYYSRPIDEGTWQVTFSAPGYYSKSLPVTVSRRETTPLDIQLLPVNYGLQETTASGIHISPNPTEGPFTIWTGKNAGNTSELRVYSFSGKEMLYRTLTVNQVDGTAHTDISHLPAGIYLVKISNAGREYTAKVVRY